jgi:hypothetical protein
VLDVQSRASLTGTNLLDCLGILLTKNFQEKIKIKKRKRRVAK